MYEQQGGFYDLAEASVGLRSTDSINCVSFDIFDEALWAGSASGVVSQLLCPTLERYSSLAAHQDQVVDLRSAGEAAVSLSATELCVLASGGAPRLTHTDQVGGPSCRAGQAEQCRLLGRLAWCFKDGIATAHLAFWCLDSVWSLFGLRHSRQPPFVPAPCAGGGHGRPALRAPQPPGAGGPSWWRLVHAGLGDRQASWHGVCLCSFLPHPPTVTQCLRCWDSGHLEPVIVLHNGGPAQPAVAALGVQNVCCLVVQVDTGERGVVGLCGPVARGAVVMGSADGYISLLDLRGGLRAEASLLAHAGGFAALDARGEFVATCGYANRMGRVVLEGFVKVGRGGWGLAGLAQGSAGRGGLAGAGVCWPVLGGLLPAVGAPHTARQLRAP